MQPVNCKLKLKELGVEDDKRLKIKAFLGEQICNLCKALTKSVASKLRKLLVKANWVVIEFHEDSMLEQSSI